jgi:hypothetical protein
MNCSKTRVVAPSVPFEMRIVVDPAVDGWETVTLSSVVNCPVVLVNTVSAVVSAVAKKSWRSNTPKLSEQTRNCQAQVRITARLVPPWTTAQTTRIATLKRGVILSPMGQLIRVVFVGVVAMAGICVAEGTGYCSKCKAVDCSFDTQCGTRCTCVKLNGKIKGQCVEQW